MLSAKDLMIGDWVFGCYNPNVDIHPNRVPVVVTRLGTGDDIFTDAPAPLQYDIEPIPITPEILKKNGFKEIGSYYSSSLYVWRGGVRRNVTSVSITFYDEPVNGVKMLTEIETDSSHDSGINTIHSCDIEFVHQLQHAIRLCGIEKEITL